MDQGKRGQSIHSLPCGLLPSFIGVIGVCFRWNLQVCLRKTKSCLAFHVGRHISFSISCQNMGLTRLLPGKMGREVCCWADPSNGASWHTVQAVFRSTYLPANRYGWKTVKLRGQTVCTQVPAFWLTIYSFGETTWSLCASVFLFRTDVRCWRIK